MIGGFGVKIGAFGVKVGVKIWPPRPEMWALWPIFGHIGSRLVALGSKKVSMDP